MDIFEQEEVERRSLSVSGDMIARGFKCFGLQNSVRENCDVVREKCVCIDDGSLTASDSVTMKSF